MISALRTAPTDVASVSMNASHPLLCFNTRLGRLSRVLVALVAALAGGCGDEGFIVDDDATDITNQVFSSREADCEAYVKQYQSHVNDVLRNVPFSGAVEVSLSDDVCTIASNGIPNHDFNDGDSRFPNDVTTQNQFFSFAANPRFADRSTPLSLGVDTGVMLNGVKVDLLAAACFGVADEKIGCFNEAQPWRFDPLFGPNGFEVDSNNAHTQPDGTYHYHGPPHALYDDSGDEASGLIGFAADGFPIFGAFFDDGGEVRRARSSYQLREGQRPSGAGDPGGTYNGAFRDDYVFVEGAGDLDECNGMTTADGVYGYYVTDTYPWVLGCFRGSPDPSFNKGPP